MNEIRIKVRYIYCYWLVLWVVLYKLGIITISPSISLIAGIIFTIFFLNSIEDIDYRYIIICLFWHIVLLMLVKVDLSKKAIFYNIFIFTLYMFYLALSDKSFQYIYFDKITKYYKGRSFSLKRYITNIIQNV